MSDVSTPAPAPAAAASARAAVPVLPARDVAETVLFFGAKLGFTTLFCHGEPSEYAGLRRDDVELHLFRCEEPNIATWTSCRVQVQGIDAIYEELKAQDVIHPNGAIADKPWGSREFTALTPDGVCLVFAEQVAAG